MHMYRTDYNSPNPTVPPKVDWPGNRCIDYLSDGRLEGYRDLKELAELRMLASVTEAELLYNFKLLRYVEHRAWRENEYVV